MRCHLSENGTTLAKCKHDETSPIIGRKVPLPSALHWPHVSFALTVGLDWWFGFLVWWLRGWNMILVNNAIGKGLGQSSTLMERCSHCHLSRQKVVHGTPGRFPPSVQCPSRCYGQNSFGTGPWPRELREMLGRSKTCLLKHTSLGSLR